MKNKEIKTDKILDDILEFVISFRGKTKMPYDKILVMYDLHNRYFKEIENNTNCDLCVIRVFSKLNKVAMQYQNKKI